MMTRREMVMGMTGMAAAAAVAGQAGQSPGAMSPTRLLVGCYAPQGLGVYGWALDATSSRLQPMDGPAALTRSQGSPSWLLRHPRLPLVYAALEGEHHIAAYRLAASGELHEVQRLPSGGQGPVHISLSPDSRQLLVAHYGDAALSVLAVGSEGQLGPAQSWPATLGCEGAACQVGPSRALKAPPGSQAISGHDAPHAHMIQPSPSGRWWLSTDLGRDQLQLWRPTPQGRPSLQQNQAMSPGSGPRHFVQRPVAGEPSQVDVYVLHEEASTLAWLRLDDAAGRLTLRDEISALPPGFAGTNFASDLMIAPGGQQLYALNRLHDSISVLQLAPDGAPRFVDSHWTRGSYPRSGAVSSTGQLVICNQRSDHLTVFDLAQPAQPRFTGQYVPVPSPACALFV